MSSLAGKVVLITGASGAVGQACAQALSAAGARLMLTDLVESAASPAESAFQAADVTDRAAVGAVVAAAVARFGQVDAAVLAAGTEGVAAPVEEITEADMDAAWSVNVKGVLFAMQACLPHMKARGAGSIVALSSISGVVGSAQLAAYSATKHAVIGLVRTAALESARHGVRINAVCPGPIESPMMRRLDKALSDRNPGRAGGQADAAKALPQQRYVTAAEVAALVAFLCGDEAGSCHGGSYMVDGGFTAR